MRTIFATVAVAVTLTLIPAWTTPMSSSASAEPVRTTATVLRAVVGAPLISAMIAGDDFGCASWELMHPKLTGLAGPWAASVPKQPGSPRRPSWANGWPSSAGHHLGVSVSPSALGVGQAGQLGSSVGVVRQ
jgi:hypothetical protein